jgi:SSS family solute:Na+ symporter/sodium/proline symporter
VSNAWAGFGAAFGPVVIGSLYWKAMTRNGALAGMLVGALTVLLWIYAPFTINGLAPSSFIYEIVPGFVLCALTIFVVSKITPESDENILTTFDEVESVHSK